MSEIIEDAKYNMWWHHPRKIVWEATGISKEQTSCGGCVYIEWAESSVGVVWLWYKKSPLVCRQFRFQDIESLTLTLSM